MRMKIFKPGDFPVLVDSGRLRQMKSDSCTYLPNYHSELEFHLIRHGNGQYFIRDVNYPSEKNSVFIMHNDEVHCFIPDPGSSAKNISLIFSARLLKDRQVACTAIRSLESVHHLVLTDKQAARTELLLSEIADECNDKNMHWQRAVVNLIEIFLVMLERASAGTVVDSKNKDPLIQEVIKYLDETFAEKPSLVDVADRFCLSSFTLSKKFKQYVGLGFREYLIHRRIVEAQRLLKETDLKVAAIAYQVGFESLSAFNFNFLRLTCVTPIVYRTLSFADQENAVND